MVFLSTISNEHCGAKGFYDEVCYVVTCKTVLVPCPRSPGRVYILKIGLPTGKKKKKIIIQFILHFISQSSSGDNQTTYPTNLADKFMVSVFPNYFILTPV